MRQINQRGIAIGPILYIVAILAVLVSAIAAGSGSFNSDTSAVKAKAQATAFLEYADEVKFAVDRVLGKGFTDTHVSFEETSGLSKRPNGTIIDHTNPNCTQSDCKVFNPEGGGVIPRLMPAGAVVDPSTVPSVANSWHPQSFKITTRRILNVGTDTGAGGTELVLLVGRPKNSVCMKINDMLGIPNPGGKPPIDSWDCGSSAFTGVYSVCNDPIGNSVPALAGKLAFCLSDDGTESNNGLVRVLISR
ncbi:MAG: hypothetical protein IPI58_06795 [Alphaproteobacteria bacterium]|nr:MAG: hypothetical protein IPI58_06795 [Alphaproteobacteria bacterium]